MWELSISVNVNKIEIAKYIYQKLKEKTAEFGAIVTCYEQFDNQIVHRLCD